jgi:hypothetical protein
MVIPPSSNLAFDALATVSMCVALLCYALFMSRKKPECLFREESLGD